MTSKTQEQLSPWTPDTNKTNLRVLGKALEELSECSSALARCVIQGIEESEPVTGKPNKQWLQEEISDVYATLGLVRSYMRLDDRFISDRAVDKAQRLNGWIDSMAREEYLDSLDGYGDNLDRGL